MTVISNFTQEAIVDKIYQVGKYQVHEKIYQTGSDFPDPKYERSYKIKNGDRSVNLGRFMNEDKQGIGIEAPPKMVGEWLVVFSANRVFLWKSGSEPIEFEPYRASNWQKYSDLGINGHYDYYSSNFFIKDARWFFEYRCANQPCLTMKDDRAMPEKILFSSDDRGQTFHVLENSKAQK
ncbi:MAG: hypothetical protein ACRC62_14255 [Microcoleus sp.]